MHNEAGGATARSIYHTSQCFRYGYTCVLPLRLHLKRLIVGGMEKVYEIGRVFRNEEGIDTTHNPEFTMMEVYTAYHDYLDVMNLTEGIIRDVAKKCSKGQQHFLMMSKVLI